MFELPPPPLSGFSQQKYSGYSHPTTQPTPTATTLTSVGNLLTPPSNSSADGLTPGSSALTTGSSLSNQGSMPSYTQNGSAMWAPPSSSSTTTYGFHQSAPPPQFSQRPLFSPSLNSIIRGTNSPSGSDVLPPPPYELPQYQSSMPMPAPSLQTLPHQQQMNSNSMMGGQTPVSASVTQPSPVHAQEPFSRPPPTPTYYGSQPSSTPQQPNFPYSSGPSPIQQSPVSAGAPLKMSPVNGQGHMPPLHHQPPPPQYTHQRPYSYPGPVLSNINNPGGQLALVGGMPHGMMGPGYNSGHAASMHNVYGHPQQANQHNDRPFRCDQCPQSFNRNHDLKRHKRIHLAVKPFPCGHCDKSFSRKDALKRHVLVKGCGKAMAAAEVKELTGSISPKSENSPIPASA
ncbi:hypothetical protein LTR85_009861 [Meristemomyces frigidus]|nr:hypothetical protein LTR85_009861 [Meristemomyces frigidus]